MILSFKTIKELHTPNFFFYTLFYFFVILSLRIVISADAAVQKKEVHEEGYANNDGSEVVAKKMTRVITTSQSAVSG